MIKMKYLLAIAALLCYVTVLNAESKGNDTITAAPIDMTFNSSHQNVSDHQSPECVLKPRMPGQRAGSRMTIPVITFTASTVGNTIAIFVIWRNQKRSDKKSVFYTLVMSLAMLDLISTLVTSPVTFLAYNNNQCVMDMGGKPLCEYSGFAMIFFGTASMAVVFAMSFERFIAIRFAFFYHTKVTPFRTRSMIIGLNAFFLLLSAMPLVGFGQIQQQYPGTWCFIDWKSHIPTHQAFNLLVAVLGTLMMVGTVVSNLYVVVRVIMKRKKMRIRNSTMQVMSKTRLKKIAYDETQMMVLLGVMTCVFIICYLPLLLRILINQLSTIYSPEADNSTTIPWDLFAVRMAAINPVLDPWVYILCRRSTMAKFGNLMKMLFTCKCSKTELQNICLSGREYKRRASAKSLSATAFRQTKVTESTTQEAVEKKFVQLWKTKAQVPAAGASEPLAPIPENK
ncbi:prostaglandin E2 receptor EP4 subtype-like [Ciona intestinalis]